jgi:hypothetical protein
MTLKNHKNAAVFQNRVMASIAIATWKLEVGVGIGRTFVTLNLRGVCLIVTQLKVTMFFIAFENEKLPMKNYVEVNLGNFWEEKFKLIDHSDFLMVPYLPDRVT